MKPNSDHTDVIGVGLKLVDMDGGVNTVFPDEKIKPGLIILSPGRDDVTDFEGDEFINTFEVGDAGGSVVD